MQRTRQRFGKGLTTALVRNRYIRKVFEGYERDRVLWIGLAFELTPCLPPSRDIKVVPILVGSISTSSERAFGTLLAPYLADPHTLFVVSSDFCHWGSRFRYTHYHPPSSSDPKAGTTLTSRNFATATAADGPVWQAITQLDRLGMDAIAFGGGPGHKTAAQAHDEFAAYLRQTKNTICGRHPIGVLLGALAALEAQEASAGAAAGQVRAARCEWTRYEQSSRVETFSDSSVSYASAVVAFGSNA